MLWSGRVTWPRTQCPWKSRSRPWRSCSRENTWLARVSRMLRSHTSRPRSSRIRPVTAGTWRPTTPIWPAAKQTSLDFYLRLIWYADKTIRPAVKNIYLPDYITSLAIFHYNLLIISFSIKNHNIATILSPYFWQYCQHIGTIITVP